MDEVIMRYESLVRLGAFIGVLGLMAAWQAAAPRRRTEVPTARRWTGNIGLIAVGTLLSRLIFPAGAVAAALFAARLKWGVFNYVDTPYWAKVLLSVAALDLAIYLQHVMFHAIPALWRLHCVHHVDVDVDVTTGVRFHPVEIVLSMGIKLVVVVALGAPALAVVIFEVLLNACAMFNHGNVRLPLGLDRLLRLLIVTPDMHRVHHSVESDEMNTNYGFSLSWWDRLLGTYRAQPKRDHEKMLTGVKSYRDPILCSSLVRMLLLPLFAEPVRTPASATRKK